MTPRSLVGQYKQFQNNTLPSIFIATLKLEAKISFEKSVTINQHRILSQKTVVFIIGAIKEQNLL